MTSERHVVQMKKMMICERKGIEERQEGFKVTPSN